MQDLNDQPDEQFRAAVEKVTLKPADSKWDELSGRIISIKRSSMADTIRVKYRRWMMVALFVLLPVALFFLMPVFSGFDSTRGKKTGVRLQKNSTENVNQKSTAPRKSDSLILNPVVNFSQIPGPANVEAQAISPAQSYTSGAAETRIPQQGQSVSPSSNQTKTSLQEKSVTMFAVQTDGSGEAQSVTNSETASSNHTDQGNRTVTGSANREGGTDAFDFSSSTLSEPSTKQTSVGLAGSDALYFAPVYTKAGASSLDNKEAAPLTLQSQTNLPLKRLDIPRRQGIYLGLAGGPLLTQVKNQGLKKSGYDFGLLAGYTLNKKFSIETGFYYTHQYFYVSGKYYNEIAGINYAAGLEGNRNAFEIPLTLKYNLIRRAGGTFFVTAGASTFVGVNDKVLIQVADGTIPPSVHFDYGVTNYMPSYVNVSLGYEYKIGKSADIRIEPYFQIPLNSNTGNSFKTESSGSAIRVFNAGIHIGISQFLHKNNCVQM